MATLDDLSQGFVTLLAGLLFPGTTFQSGSVGSIQAPWTGAPGAAAVTVPARLYRGAPGIYDVRKDINSGIAQVIVTCERGMSRNTDRFAPRYETISANEPTLLVSWTADQVVFSGSCAAGQVAGLTVNNICYAYRTTSDDTPSTVAAAFAGEIPGAVASGGTVAVYEITSALVVCDQAGVYRMGQQQQMIGITVLAPTTGGATAPLVRAAVGRAVETIKTRVRPDGTPDRFIGLPDGTTAHIRFHHGDDDDTPRNDDLWRRWFYFLCEFDETLAVLQPTALTVNTLMQSGAALVWLGAAPTVPNMLTDGAGNALVGTTGNVLGSF